MNCKCLHAEPYMILHSLEICQPVLAITASKSLKCWFPTGHDDDKTEANWKDPEYCVTDGPAIYKESFAPDAVGRNATQVWM